MGNRPASPEAIKSRVGYYSHMEVGSEMVDRGLMGVMTGKLIKLTGSDQNRYALLWFLFDWKWKFPWEASSKDLTASEKLALFKWMQPYKANHMACGHDSDANDGGIPYCQECVNVPDGHKVVKGEWLCHPAVDEEVKEIMNVCLPHVQILRERLHNMNLDELPDDFVPEEIQKELDDGIMMLCGHEADELTVLGNPVCMQCADGGANRDAYQEKSCSQ